MAVGALIVHRAHGPLRWFDASLARHRPSVHMENHWSYQFLSSAFQQYGQKVPDIAAFSKALMA